MIPTTHAPRLALVLLLAPACTEEEEGAPLRPPPDVQAVVDEYRAITDAYCAARSPNDTAAIELCNGGRALAIDGFPDGFSGCFELIATQLEGGAALYTATADCFSPHLDGFTRCLDAAAEPEQVLACEQAYRTAVEASCLELPEYDTLWHEALECGYCETYVEPEPGLRPPRPLTYCIEDIARD